MFIHKKCVCAIMSQYDSEGHFQAFAPQTKPKKTFHGKPIILPFQLGLLEFSGCDLQPQLNERGEDRIHSGMLVKSRNTIEMSVTLLLMHEESVPGGVHMS